MSAKISTVNRELQFQFCQKLRTIIKNNYASVYELTQMFSAKASTVRTWASKARIDSKTQAFPGMSTVTSGMPILDEVINRATANQAAATSTAPAVPLIVNSGITYTVDGRGSVVRAERSEPETTVSQLLDVLANRALDLDDKIATMNIALEEMLGERAKLQIAIDTVRSL